MPLLAAGSSQARDTASAMTAMATTIDTIVTKFFDALNDDDNDEAAAAE